MFVSLTIRHYAASYRYGFLVEDEEEDNLCIRLRRNRKAAVIN